MCSDPALTLQTINEDLNIFCFFVSKLLFLLSMPVRRKIRH